MDELEFTVDGLPPVKNEAKSLLSAGHSHFSRVDLLLNAARNAVENTKNPHYGTAIIGMYLELSYPSRPPSDATNYLGGIGDVLEDKSSRRGLDDLGELMQFALYANDSQIQEIQYRWVRRDNAEYRLRYWTLPEQ